MSLAVGHAYSFHQGGACDEAAAGSAASPDRSPGVAHPRAAGRLLPPRHAAVPGAENLRNVFMIQPIGLGLASLGQAFVVISGGIDLSVGSVISLRARSPRGCTRPRPRPPLLVVLLLVLVGAAAGSINGLLVVPCASPRSWPRSPRCPCSRAPCCSTRPGPSAASPPPTGSSPTAPSPVSPFGIILFAAVLAACWYLLRRNRLGRHIYAVGADPFVAQISGIPVPGCGSSPTSSAGCWWAWRPRS